MAGEINGTTVLVQKGAAEIVGQMEMTITQNGTPIDISNKSYGDFVTLLSGQLAGKQYTIAVSCTYNDDTVFGQMLTDSETGVQDTYSITIPAYATISGKFVPTGLSLTAPHGAAVTASINLLSSGAYTVTPI